MAFCIHTKSTHHVNFHNSIRHLPQSGLGRHTTHHSDERGRQERHRHREVTQVKWGSERRLNYCFFFPAKHQQDTEQEVQEVKRKLTASNLTTVSIFLTALSVSTLTMMSPAGREKVREEMLGEERGFVPPLERTM